MVGYRGATGRSLISDLNKELTMYKNLLRDNTISSHSYGISDKAIIQGTADGIKANIKRREQAVKALMSARSEYETLLKKERIVNARTEQLRKKGIKWM